MKVLLAVPTFETISPETFDSLWHLDKNGFDCDFAFVKGYDCAKARNEIAKKAKKDGFDFVLMVDSDVILPKDALQLLLGDYPDIPELVLGVVPKKNTKNKETEIFSFSANNFGEANRYRIQEVEQLVKKGTRRIQVKGGGFGCALVNVTVFGILPYPWFRYINYPDGGLLSEDLYFCDLLNRHEYVVAMDPRVRCGHMVREFHYE